MSDDTIYRQAAIKAIEDLPNCYNGFSDTYDKSCIIGVLETLPSAQPEIKCIAKIMLTEEQVQEVFEKAKKEILAAQPERKEGHWIRKSNWMWTCSCCGKDNAYAYAADDACKPTVLQDFFCPNCGADMRGEQDE